MNSDSDDDYVISGTPPEIRKLADAVSLDLLPSKSRKLYEKEYETFTTWCKQKNVSNIASESVLLAYLSEKSKTLKSSSLWSKFSMIKAVLNVEKNIDVSKYQKVKAFLKRQGVGYRAKKSKVFYRADIERFLLEASDEIFLLSKVALIMGLAGALRREELYNMTTDNIEKVESVLVITIPDSKTHIQRKFTLIGTEVHGINLLDIYKKYTALRPANVKHNKFFVQYRKGKCTVQTVGINQFSKIPSTIARCLGLQNPEQYTGHSFRRSSASLLASSGADIFSIKRHGGWKSSTVAEGYIEDSIQNKVKTSYKIFQNSSPSDTENIPPSNVDVALDVVTPSVIIPSVTPEFNNATLPEINIDQVSNQININRSISLPKIPGININNVTNSTIQINFK